MLKFSSHDLAITSSSSAVALKKTPVMQIIGLKHTISAFKYEKFQVDFGINISGLEGKIDPFNIDYLNPFDPDDIEVSVTFFQGLRKKRLPAYWAIKYDRDESIPDPTHLFTLGMANNPHLSSVEHPEYLKENNTDITPWHARFAPPTEGKWEYSITVVLYKGKPDEVTIGHTPRKDFFVSPSSNKGYVSVVKPERNFRFRENGQLFYPIGTTAAWRGLPNYNRVGYTYTKYTIDETSKYLGNHCRLFLTNDKFSIETGRLTRFTDDDAQKRATDVDDLVEHALRKNVYLQLVLEERLEFRDVEKHPDFDNYFWQARNPYSKINATPKDFWTNSYSKKIYKKKLRYIMARWGYATGIFAFEFMNEVTLAFGYDTFWNNGDLPYTVSDWVNEMLQYCKGELNDEHLYTISTVGRTDERPNNIYEPWTERTKDEFIKKMDIDFYTDHLYTSSQFQDYEINYLANRMKFKYPDKPYILNEFGFNNVEDGGREKMCAGVLHAEHFLSRHPFVTNLYDAGEIHYGIWTSLMSGSSGLCTLWDDYSNFRPWGGQISNFVPLVYFIQGEDMNL